MTPAMEAAVARYFAAEKRESAVFLAVGAGGLVLSAALCTWGGAYRGMVPPLAVVAVIQVVVGATVLGRTKGQVSALRRRLETAPEDGRRRELERMERVLTSFRLYKAIEIAVLTAGLTLLFLFPRHHRLYAAGLGCLLQGSVLLVLDRRAEGRGRDYTEALRRAD